MILDGYHQQTQFVLSLTVREKISQVSQKLHAVNCSTAGRVMMINDFKSQALFAFILREFSATHCKETETHRQMQMLQKPSNLLYILNSYPFILIRVEDWSLAVIQQNGFVKHLTSRQSITGLKEDPFTDATKNFFSLCCRCLFIKTNLSCNQVHVVVSIAQNFTQPLIWLCDCLHSQVHQHSP